jgi:hypothetical protein
MIIITMGLIGAFIGGRTAQKRQGNRKDIAQFAGGYAIAFMICGLFVTVLIDRMLVAA